MLQFCDRCGRADTKPRHSTLLGAGGGPSAAVLAIAARQLDDPPTPEQRLAWEQLVDPVWATVHVAADRDADPDLCVPPDPTVSDPAPDPAAAAVLTATTTSTEA